MTDHTTAAQADTKEIRAGFELCYAVEADDPANVSDLGHFTNGWRACIMSQVRAPVAGERFEREALRRDERLREAAATFLTAYRARYSGAYGQIKKHAPLQDQVLALVFASREAPPSDDDAPQACEAQCSCPSGDGSLRWPCAAHAARPEVGRLKLLAAALGNRDWKWWDSCSFRRLTFEDGPDRRDGSALHATVQVSDGHPDVSMAPGVREFIEAASPQAVGQLADQAARLAAQLRECADTLGADKIGEQRAMRAYADAKALLDAMPNL
ncbi:hypothetical protein [Achromobacter animicus]|uniref:hypothetical protein n=1 Tax=Achromobacter animicus TaxID=1389935 RepID=UPI001467F765|nr:hypothetical protein [Achromobacter animicus]CAB3849816.1 hypothetical protein LMG26691_01923 [Achromobacter animicus]